MRWSQRCKRAVIPYKSGLKLSSYGGMREIKMRWWRMRMRLRMRKWFTKYKSRTRAASLLPQIPPIPSTILVQLVANPKLQSCELQLRGHDDWNEELSNAREEFLSLHDDGKPPATDCDCVFFVHSWKHIFAGRGIAYWKRW